MDTKLKKELGLATAITTVVGMVIGSGIFFKPQSIYTSTGAPGIGMIAWIVAGLITIAGGLSTAELAASIPKTGGMVVWMEEAYGPKWGYLLGWVESVVFWPANIGALSIVFATQVVDLLGLGDSYITMIAIISLFFLVFMNCLGAKIGGMIGNIFTIGKIIPITVIIIMGLARGTGGVARLLPMTAADHPVATSLGAAMLACMFAYDGWIHVGNISGELKNPQKDLPKAIVMGLTICIVVYVMINVAYLFVLPASTLAVSKTPAADVCRALFGKNGGNIVSIGIMVSIFGTLNSNIMCGMRIPYSMGVQNKLPGSKYFAYLHPKFATPIYSGIFTAILTSIMIMTGSFNSLTDMCIFVIWIFYVMAFLAVIRLRKTHPELERPYKVPLYPVIPILASIGGAYIIVSNLISQPINAGIGLALTLIGLPIYYARKSKFKDISAIDE